MFAGTQTAGLSFGGQQPPQTPSTVAVSLSYNGSSWTATNSMTEGKSSGAGFGTSTAALAAGGSAPPFTDNSQTWDGTNWTNTPSLNTPRSNLRGWGSNTSGAVAAGRTPTPAGTAQTEEWNGSSWVTSVNLGTGGYLGSTAGGPGAPSGLYAGGGRLPSLGAVVGTEEFNGETTAVRAVKTIDFDQNSGIIYIYIWQENLKILYLDQNLRNGQEFIKRIKTNKRSVASRNIIDRGDKYGTNRRT